LATSYFEFVIINYKFYDKKINKSFGNNFFSHELIVSFYYLIAYFGTIIKLVYGLKLIVYHFFLSV